ncbi:MAG: dihydrodipicolinate synthase family protein [Chloroflexi bacterium]|nr:dihydrodipicolinate synthase family protein [Chloroflexota bacterium]
MTTHDLTGIIPPMTTAFDTRENIDTGAVTAQVQFLASAGVNGICAGGSIGEGYTLEARELETLWTTVARAASPRPLVAGIIVNSTKQAIERCRIAKGAGAGALQVTPPHYLFKPDDEACLAHFRDIAEATDLPVLIYNVIPWCYLSAALMIRIMREVPGVLGVKQSNSDMKAVADLLMDLPPGKIVHSAIDALLYPTFALGAHGSIAAVPSAVPFETVAMWNAVQKKDYATAERLTWPILRLWNTIAGDLLPSGVKYVQSLQGVPSGYPRRPMRDLSDDQKSRVREAFAALKAV